MNSQPSLRRRKSSLKDMSAPKSNKSVTFHTSVSEQRFATAYAKCDVLINSYEKLPLDAARRPRKALFGLEPPPFLTEKENEDYTKECLKLVDTLNLDRSTVSRGTMDRASRARLALWGYWVQSRAHWIEAGRPGIGVQQHLTQAFPPVDTGDTTTPDRDDDHTDGEDYEMPEDDADDYDSYQDHSPVWENAGSGTEVDGNGLEMMQADSGSDSEDAYYSREEENSTGVLDQGTINNDDFFGGSHFTPINAQPAHLLGPLPPFNNEG